MILLLWYTADKPDETSEPLDDAIYYAPDGLHRA
jgi:hypothetical protein